MMIVHELSSSAWKHASLLLQADIFEIVCAEEGTFKVVDVLSWDRQ